MATVVITAPATAEATAVVDIKTESLVLVGASGLAGAETVSIAVDDGLGSFEPLVIDSAALGVDTANTAVHLRGPGRYELTKATTGASAHVFMYIPAKAEVEWEEV